MHQPRPIAKGSTVVHLIATPAIALASFSGMALLLGRPKRSRFSPFRRQRRGTALNDKRVRSMVEAAQEAVGTARSQIDLKSAQVSGDEMARRIGTLVGTTRAGLPPLTQEAAERARLVAERLREEGLTRSAELGERIKTDVAPVARGWAQEALEEAEEILAAARERAADLSTTARKDYAPEISTKAGAAAGLVAGTAATAAQALGKRVGEIGTTATSKKGRKRFQRQRGKAGQAVRKAGSATKHATAETLAIFFWAAALGTVIYYALLTPEQRERVRSFLSGAATQIQDVVTDFQTGDEEFQSTPV